MKVFHVGLLEFIPVVTFVMVHVLFFLYNVLVTIHLYLFQCSRKRVFVCHMTATKSRIYVVKSNHD